MALDAATLADALKTKTKAKLEALSTAELPISIADSPMIDAFYLALAEAIVEHIANNAEVQPGTFVADVVAVTGTGSIA